MRYVVTCALLLCLAACSTQAWIDRLASRQEQLLAIQTAEQLRSGDLGKIAEKAAPELQPQLSRGVAGVRAILARTSGRFTLQTVNVTEQIGGHTTKAYTLEAGADSKWVILEVVFQGTPESPRLIGFHAWPANSQPSRLNDFEVDRRGLLGFFWLSLMFGSAALCVTAVALIWRRPWLKRRWLWTLGSLFGVAGFGLNWSNGAWAILFINVSLFGATAIKAGPYAPWLLHFGIPVVAIIVIVRWFREGRKTADAE